MSDLSDDELEGIVYVEDDGTPEEVVPESRDAHLEEKVVDMPDVMMASDLLPPEDDPLSSLPVEPPDEDTPPEEAAPTFIVTPATAAKRESVRLADGTPVGVWLAEEHPDLDGVGVAELLAEMGLSSDLALWFGNQRAQRIAANTQLAGTPVVQKAMAQESVRLAQKKAVQEAFVKSQKEKKK